jgi:hypothetical protein
MRIQSTVAPHVSIEAHNPAGVQKAETALQRIASRPNGSNLLAEIARYSTHGRSLRINVTSAEISSAARAALTTRQALARGIPDSDLNKENNRTASSLARKTGWRKAEGSSAVVDWNPSEYPDIDAHGRPRLVNDEDHAFVSLAHELVHGYRMMKGTYTGGDGSDRYQSGTPAAIEEERAVGIGRYAGKPLSENGIRREHDLPLRAQYRAAPPVYQPDDNAEMVFSRPRDSFEQD